jgi:mono/diheme cytochrome c family protein
MKMKKAYCLQVLFVLILILTGGCTKKGGDTSSLYTPSGADVTANATLEELQQGRVLYIENCNSCHGLYNPDSNSPSQWRSILSNMAPKAGLSSSETQLVTKYLTRGN